MAMNVKKVFAPKGLLAKHFQSYEQRPQQLRMAELVASAIKLNSPAVIEGASGVGKSFAYLVPLILSKKKAIISTSNKSLQDQLSKKDLPALKKILPIDFNWAVLKGKNNYFCFEHFQMYKKDLKRLFSKEELKRIIHWSELTEDGDVEYYPTNLPKEAKELITCDTRTIHDKASPFYELCFANKARAKAKQAQIVLVNHTLLALDIALKIKSGNLIKFLPKVDVIIIDEVHTFERYAVMAFSDEVNLFSLHHLLKRSIIKKSVKRKQLESLYKAFSANLMRFLPEKRVIYYQQKKVPYFDGFKPIIKRIKDVLERITSNPKFQKDDVSQKTVKEVVKEGEHLIERLRDLGVEDENMLRWSEARERPDGSIIITLKSVPLVVSEILKEHLFQNKAVICTSATLAVNRNFDFFKYQIGVPETALEKIEDSPFDYKKNVLIYISKGEQEKRWEIEQLLKFSKGNAFILFTSYKDMYENHQIVNTQYPKLVQKEGMSRAYVLKKFRETPHAVLFATKSFWEGVDVPGMNLVVIYKLPFETPSDLLYSSKIKRIDEKLGKGKHWMKYTVPDVCLKLKQGIGRLIRNKNDFGVIALLDARVNFRNYGKIVVNTLPPAYRTQRLEKVKKFFKSKGV